MPLAIFIALVVFAVASAADFYLRKLFLPALASAEGAAIDQQFAATFLTLGILFVLAHILLGWFAYRYRARKGATASGSRGNLFLEVALTVVALILFSTLAVTGNNVYAIARRAPEEKPIVVEVTGMQFAWYYRYPGADGEFGRTKPELQDASLGNPLGIDPADHAGKDDVVTSVLTVPDGQPVKLELRAQDVIHSFFVPAMRFKHDAVPGLRSTVYFTPNRTGEFPVACAELCGLGHYKMNSRMVVLPRAEFEKWLGARMQAKAGGAQ